MIRQIIILTFLIVGLSSCKTDTKDPKDILNSSNITLTIKHVGCFGGSTQVITIKKNNGTRTLTNKYTEGVTAPEIIVPFNTEKEKILADLITAGFSEADSTICTGHSTYNIKTEKFKCTFVDNTCRLHDYLVKLLEKETTVHNTTYEQQRPEGR